MLTEATETKRIQLKLDDVCQRITPKDAAAIMGWTEGYLRSFKTRGQYELDPEWHWINGVCYFQVSPGGKVVYNSYILKLWHIAKCQGDPTIYLDAVSRFQKAIGR